MLKHGRAVMYTAAKKRKETKLIRQAFVKSLARVCDNCEENLN